MQPVFTLGETLETHQFSEYTSQVWKNPLFNTTASYSLLDRAVERSIIPTAIHWVCQQPQAQMIPILGARSVKQLQDNLGVLA